MYAHACLAAVGYGFVPRTICALLCRSRYLESPPSRLGCLLRLCRCPPGWPCGTGRRHAQSLAPLPPLPRARLPMPYLVRRPRVHALRSARLRLFAPRLPPPMHRPSFASAQPTAASPIARPCSAAAALITPSIPATTALAYTHTHT